MSKEYSIFSTMSTDVNYTFYEDSGNGISTPTRMIVIAGKANVINGRFVTPRGAVTPVDDHTLALLQTHPVFIKHLQNGFIAVEARGTKVEDATKDMVPRDESAQLEAGDYDEGQTPLVASVTSREDKVPSPVAKKKRANTSRQTLE